MLSFTEAYLEPNQTSMTRLNLFIQKSSIVDVRLGSNMPLFYVNAFQHFLAFYSRILEI